MQRETRHKGNDLPLYSEGGLLSIPLCNGAPLNLVVFVPERIDMEAGMVYGYLPEYGGRKHTSAALSHQKLARSRKGIKTLLSKIRRTYNPIAAQIVSMADMSASGIEEFAIDEAEEDSRNNGSVKTILHNHKFAVTLERFRVDEDDEIVVIERWQRASRAASICDKAAIASGVNLSAARRIWLWGALQSIQDNMVQISTKSNMTQDGTQVSGSMHDHSSSIPLCNKGHTMIVSDGAFYYRDFACEKCNTLRSGKRWFCFTCSEDLCFECCSQPLSKKIKAQIEARAAAAAAAAAADDQDGAEKEEDSRSNDDEATKILWNFFLALARSEVTNQEEEGHLYIERIRAIAKSLGGAELANAIMPLERTQTCIDYIALAKSIITESARIMQRSLKPVIVKREVKLQHISAEAIISAAREAVATPSTLSNKNSVTATIMSPPLYSLKVLAPPQEIKKAKQLLEVAEARAIKALQDFKARDKPSKKPSVGEILIDEADHTLQPTINIGLVGHVAHGKSSVCRYLSGKRTQQHSQEHKLHGATIKLGYANCKVCRCVGTCSAPECFTTMGGDDPSAVTPACKCCGGATHVVKHVSFIDCPGHHDLISTMLTGTSAFDAALVIVAANEIVPAPQTASHLAILTEIGFCSEQICVLQNKAELSLCASGRAAGVANLQSHAEACQMFMANNGSAANRSPLIPVSAQLGHNMDAVAEWIASLPEPKKSLDAASRLAVIRSFDTNKAGTCASNMLRGGVLGGALLHGRIKAGDHIEIRPGCVRQEKSFSSQLPVKSKKSKEWMETKIEERTFEPIIIRVNKVMSGKTQLLDGAVPGGLIALEVDLDPSLTRGDACCGMVAGTPGSLPPVYSVIVLNIKWLLPKQLGKTEDFLDWNGNDLEIYDNELINEEKWCPPKLVSGARMRVSVGSTISLATIIRSSNKRARVELKLDSVLCCEKGDRFAIEIRNEDIQASSSRSVDSSSVKKREKRAAAKKEKANINNPKVTRTGGGCGWSLVAFAEMEDGLVLKKRGDAGEFEKPDVSKEKKCGDGLVGLVDEGKEMAEMNESGGTEPIVKQHNYAHWLNRFADFLEEKNSPMLSRSKVKIPHPNFTRDGGARVVWENFGATCLALNRTPSHLASFFRNEGGLGGVSLAGSAALAAAATGIAGFDASSSNVKNIHLRIHTRARNVPDKVGRLIRQYCAAYVVCKQCRGAHTTLTRDDDENIRKRGHATSMIIKCIDCQAGAFVKPI